MMGSEDRPSGSTLDADPVGHYRRSLEEIESAIIEARAGKHGTAIERASSVLACYPSDVNIVHKTGVVLYLCGKLSDARAQFLRALELHPNFSFSLIELGNIAYDSQEFETSAQYFVSAGNCEIVLPVAFIRAAASFSELGLWGEALEILKVGADANPSDFDIAAALGRMLVFHDRRPEAVAAFARAVALRPDDPSIQMSYLNVLIETGRTDDVIRHSETIDSHSSSALRAHATLAVGHARLSRQFDLGSVIEHAAKREESTRWLSKDAVFERLLDAVRRSQPFSLTRFGDGEGRFLVLSAPSWQYGLPPEYARAVGNSIWWNWFQADLSTIDMLALTSLRSALDQAILGSDIVGVPTSARLAMDHAHIGYLAALVEHIQRFETRSSALYTDASINIDLHRMSPFYSEVIRGASFLGVIGPHEGLAERLSSRFDIPNSRTYLIPGETRLPEAARGLRTVGHWPDLYERLIRTIEVPYPGAVFLIAGGLLGKIYCNRIKQLGGIAIDVGSIVDAWTGHDTRPGQFGNLLDWRL